MTYGSKSARELLAEKAKAKKSTKKTTKK